MTNGLSNGLPVFPERTVVRWPGILSVAMVASLAVLPTHAIAEPATQPGAKVFYLAQAASDAGQSTGNPAPATPDQPAGEEAAADQETPPESSPAESPAAAQSSESTSQEAAGPAEMPTAESVDEPASEPAAEAVETPAEAAEMPAEEPASEMLSEPPSVEGLPGYPPILRKATDMPEPVRNTWTAIRDAARKGDIEALQPLIEAQPAPPTFAFAEIDHPIRYLKSLSGDPEGREILAILLEVLESGFVLADPDTPEAMYLWPYFTRYPLEELTPEQMVEMFTLLTAGDYQDMLSYGAYIFFRVGISPDGTWHFFVAGD
jgi:hypothetical protein